MLEIVKKVAKLVMIDPDDNYLLLRRDNHPTFGNDADLPGGTLENDETTAETMIREVREETGVFIDKNDVREIYAGTEYSKHGTHYSLFIAKLDKRPTIELSHEHSSYQWLNHDDFLKKVKDAKDSYVHMVHEIEVARNNSGN